MSEAGRGGENRKGSPDWDCFVEQLMNHLMEKPGRHSTSVVGGNSTHLAIDF